MTVSTAWTCNSADYSRERLLGDALPQQIMGGAAAICVAAVCAWTICINAGGGSTRDAMADRADKLPRDRPSSRRTRHYAAAGTGFVECQYCCLRVHGFPRPFRPASFRGALTDRVRRVVRTRNVACVPAARGSPQQAGRRFAETRRPRCHDGVSAAANARGRLSGQFKPIADTQATPTDKPGLLERIFGRTPHAIFAKLFGTSPSGVTLAYANTEDSVASDSAGLTSGLYDRQTAVYDISAHTVYMPDGTALEAHSGLGSRLDDPRYVAQRDRGPTPPDVYELKPRGELFHGVAALRLIPVDEKKVYGRSGLLAHTYMLGENGQSNGCVSFKDYDTFLHAYENHEITRLAVVTHVD